MKETKSGVLTQQQLKSIPCGAQEVKKVFSSDEEYKSFENKVDDPFLLGVDRKTHSCIGKPISLKDTDGNEHEGYFCVDLLNQFGVTQEYIKVGTVVKLLHSSWVDYGIVCSGRNLDNEFALGVFFHKEIVSATLDQPLLCPKCSQAIKITKDKKDAVIFDKAEIEVKKFGAAHLMIGDSNQLFSAPKLPSIKPSKNHVKWML
jgi:hypothetical protein